MRPSLISDTPQSHQTYDDDVAHEIGGDYDVDENEYEDDEGADGTVVVGGEPLELGEGVLDEKEESLMDGLGPGSMDMEML